MNIKKTLLGLGAAAEVALVAGCAPIIPAHAMTTEEGIFYYQTPTPDEIKHEECHAARAKAMGSVFFKLYSEDAKFACAEELRCGIDPSKYPKTYPRCVKYEP